jgi:hypothetical protein
MTYFIGLPLNGLKPNVQKNDCRQAATALGLTQNVQPKTKKR